MTDAALPPADREWSDHDWLAAQWALGLLEGAQRVEAARLLHASAAFRAEVAWWQAVADDWLESVDPVEPGDDLFARIEQAIENAPAPLARLASQPAARPVAARGWAIAASFAALVTTLSAGLLFVRERATADRNAALEQRVAAAESERRVAQMARPDGAILLSAMYDPAQGRLALRVAQEDRGDHAPELWVIPADGKPRSLGLFRSPTATLAVPADLRAYLTDGAKLAVTIEPVAGAPHAAPSGAIVGITELKTI